MILSTTSCSLFQLFAYLTNVYNHLGNPIMPNMQSSCRKRMTAWLHSRYHLRSLLQSNGMDAHRVPQTAVQQCVKVETVDYRCGGNHEYFKLRHVAAYQMIYGESLRISAKHNWVLTILLRTLQMMKSTTTRWINGLKMICSYPTNSRSWIFCRLATSPQGSRYPRQFRRKAFVPPRPLECTNLGRRLGSIQYISYGSLNAPLHDTWLHSQVWT